MDHKLAATVSVLFLMCVGQSFGCTISGFVQMKMFERLVQSTYVIYGRTIWHSPTKTMLNGKTQYVIDATYEVHCILKEGEDPLQEEIIISQISPTPDCFGTDVTANLKVGDYSIIALKNTTGGKYMLEEVMPELSATFSATKPYFFTLANLCGMQQWQPPVGAATNRCPICGVSDFISDVLTQSGAGLSNCVFTTNGIVSNMTACDLYISGTVDYANAQTCVPASYNQTCVTLLYRASTATCDCDQKTTNKNVGTAGGNVPAPSKTFTLFLLGLMFTLCGVSHR